MARSLRDQVIVITGASSGIGRATALKCAYAGAKVILAARTKASLDEVVEQIRLGGGSAYAIEVDVSDPAQVNNLVNEAIIAFGRIDTWVNNAAVALYGTVAETAIEEFERVIDVNFMGTYYCTKAVLPHMQRQGRGAIVNVGSVLSQRAVPLQAAYCASKFAVRGFTDALRMELMNDNADIHVSLVMPAAINTPFFTHARSRMGVRPQPFPPTYPVEQAADVIVHAIETHPREVVVGGAAILFTLMQRISPWITDRLMMANNLSIRLQQTDRADNGRDSLFTPMEDANRLSGDFAHLTKPSLYARLRTMPRAWLPLAAALFALAFFARRR